MHYYVGFPPSYDPGMKRARKGRRRVRNQVVAIASEWLMRWSMEHRSPERVANGRAFYPVWAMDQDPTKDPPDKVIVTGWLIGMPLTVYYRVAWIDKLRHVIPRLERHAQGLLD